MIYNYNLLGRGRDTWLKNDVGESFGHPPEVAKVTRTWWLSCWILLLSLFWASGLQAQVTVGSGNTTDSAAPWSSCWGYSYVQMLYPKASINTAGTITSLSFTSAPTIPTSATSAIPNTPQGANTAFKIYLGHTTKTSFTGTTASDWVPTSAMTLVYDGSITMPTVAGQVVTITLTTPFAYNNVDNLVMAFDENSPGYACSYSWIATNGQTNMTMYHRSDTVNFNPDAPIAAGSRTAITPRVTLGGLVPTTPPNCIATPTTPANAATGVLSKTLTWPAATGSPTGYTLYFGTDGGGTTTPTNMINGTALGNVTTTTLTQTFTPSTTYYWQIRPTNGNGAATGCAIWSFTTGTAPNCNTLTAPANAATNVQRNPTLSWAAASAPAASSYDVYLGTSATPPLVGNVTTLSYIPTGALLANTVYYWQIVPRNAMGAAAGPCVIRSFTTGANVVYCLPVTDYGCADGDVIARVVLNTLDNNSGTGCPSDPVPGNGGVVGGEGPGYSDYTGNPALTTTLQAGAVYGCTVYAGQWPEGYAAWIDYNDDGVFDNATERIGFSAGQVAGSGVAGVLGSSATFPIALACNPPLGQHRLRVRAMYNTNGSAVTPCTNNAFGEVEDYLITISAAAACPQPSGLTATGGTNTGGTLSWTVGCVETAWQVAVQPAGSGVPTGSGVSVTGTPTYTVSGLPSNSYEFYVRADCSGAGYSVWSGPYVFSPPACPTLISPANGATNVAMPGGGVPLTWSAPPGATSYDVYFGQTAGATVNLGNIVNTTVNITGVVNGSTNYWKIIAKGPNGDSVGCLESSFTVASCSAQTVPYTQGFESIGFANVLADCVTSTPVPASGGKVQTYLAAATGTNAALTPRTGSKFAAVYWSPSGKGTIYSPPLQLTAGVAYRASVYYRTDGAAWSTVGLYYGTTNTAAGMTNTIATVSNAAATSYTAISGDFVPAVTGTYYVAMQADNTVSSLENYCAFDDFSVIVAPPTITSISPNAVCAGPGHTVTINGANFIGSTSVEFNGVEATSFNVVSASVITAVVPASATTGLVTVTSPDGVGTSATNFTINPNPTVAPITAPGGATSVCIPETITLSTATPTGVWSSSNVDVATVNTSGVVTTLTPGSVVISYTVTNSETGCATSESYALTVNQVVLINSSTLSQSVVSNGNTSFTVNATGSGTPALQYQWYVSEDGALSFNPLSDGGVYSGTTSATLTLTGVPTEYNGFYYYASVTGACNSADSELASLIVGDTGFDDQPDNVTVCANGPGTASFSVVASEDVTTYEWYEDQGGDNWMPLTNGGMYAGVDTATLSLSGITQSNNGWRYKVVVYGIGVAESSAATLTVAQAAYFTGDPSNQTVCYAGGTVQFNAASEGGFAGYRWEYLNGSTWADVANGLPAGATYSGAATGTLTVTTTAATPASGSYSYRAVALGITPCADVPSASAQLLINNAVINTQPVAASVVVGNSASFSVAATTSQSATYVWQYATAAAGPWSNVTGNTPANVTYSNTSSPTLSVVVAANAAAGSAHYYRVIVTSGSGCSVTSSAAQLTITSYCGTPLTTSGGLSDSITNVVITNVTQSTNVTQASSGVAPWYVVYNNTPLNVTQGNNMSVAITFNTDGTQHSAIWVDYNRNGVYEASENVALSTAAAAGSSTVTYNFTVPFTATPGVTRIRIRGASDSAYTAAGACTATAWGETEDYYLNIVAAPACSGTPVAGTISTPVSSVCGSGSVTLSAAGYTTGVTGISLQWYNSAGAIASATGTTYTTPVLTAPETYYLRVTCANGGASADSNSLTINIAAPAVTGTTPGTRCGSGTVDLSGTPSAGSTLNWYANANGGAPLFTGNTFTTPVITGNTTYYVSAATTSTTLPAMTYCASTSTSTTYYITGFSTTGAPSNITNTGTAQSPSGYGDYTAQSVRQLSGSSFNFAVATPGSTYGINIWVDWNNDGDFDDAGEKVYASGAYVSSASGTINIPSGLAPGNRRMRVKLDWLTTDPPACGTSSAYAETEDYTLAVTPCESARTAVLATVTPAPTFTLSSSAVAICNGATSAPVTITAGGSDYQTFTWSPNTGVSGSAATGYTFNPTTSGTYTLTATNTTSGCGAVATVAVTVNALPAAVVVSPSAPVICSTDGAVRLAASGASSPTAGGCLTAPNGQWPSGAYVVSTCDGATANVIATNCYAGEYSVVNVAANNKYTFGSALAGDRVTVSDAAGSVVLASGLGSAVYVASAAGSVRVYTHLTSTACGSDSVNRARTVICEPLNTVTFAPVTGLYTDAGATVPYTGTAVYAVYAKPAVTTPYTVTATSTAGCTTSASVTVTVNQATTWYVDADGDGYGNSALATVQACAQPTGYAAVGGDCNDAVAAINPGHAEVLYNGVDDNCDGNLDEGFQITTKLLQSYCGATLTSISSLIGIQTLAPGSAYTGWRVRATNGAQVQTIEVNVPHFMMTQFPSYAYATTYTIEIELQRNGVWLGYYGQPCLVSTPAILEEGGAAAVSGAQCGQTLPKINTLISTTSIPGVTGYRFRVTNLTDPSGPFAEQVVTRGVNWFTLQMLTRYNYGTTYRIEVAVKTTADFGGYGAPCQVTSPAAPTLVNCGATATSGTQTIAATSSQGVTQYRFQITRASDNASTSIDRSVNYFTFNQVPATIYTAGALYYVRVAVMTTGYWSPYGDACELTAPGGVAKGETSTAADAALSFKATAYPNPFAQDFGIEVISPSQDSVTLKVYDMLGKLLESRDIPAAEMNVEKVGANYPSGVYNVIVSQSGNVRTLRVIKR